jgi:hypothetical protein
MSKERWIMKNDLISLVDDNIEIWNCDAKFICNQLNKQGQQIAELQHQLKVSEKALELACRTSSFEDTCDYCEYTKEVGCPCYCEAEQDFEYKQAMRYFKQLAEKEVEND